MNRRSHFAFILVVSLPFPGQNSSRIEILKIKSETFFQFTQMDRCFSAGVMKEANCAADDSIDRDEPRVGEIVIDRIVNGQMVYRWPTIQIAVHTSPSLTRQFDRKEQVHTAGKRMLHSGWGRQENAASWPTRSMQITRLPSNVDTQCVCIDR